MKTILPIYYAEYGRYIGKFRAIPSQIDALKLVERRLLISLYEVAKDKFQKSAKVVGYVIGKYHPHGDNSAYESLSNLVATGYAEGRGNWGSPGIIDAEPAAMRYTEVKLAKWVKDIAFEYIDYVPLVEGELDKEVEYIPCPVPIGLVGHGIITGISFYRTLIPRFKLKDLLKRLINILEDAENKELFYPEIVGCEIDKNTDELVHLYTDGYAKFTVIPTGYIQDNAIYITGKVPNTSSLIRLQEDADNLKLVVKDLSKATLLVKVTSRNKSDNLQDIAKQIWSKYLIKDISFECLFCNTEGKVLRLGLDDVILKSYEKWRQAVLDNMVDELNKLNKKQIENVAIKFIRKILEKHPTIKTIDGIVTVFNDMTKDKKVEVVLETYTNQKFTQIKFPITSDVIRDTCISKSIRQLIETEIDSNLITSSITNIKNKINSLDQICYNKVKDFMSL